MLLKLNIDNFALIEHTTVDFGPGFNVILGETGSGKSIIIDAINFMIGGKFNRNFLRTGESKTHVEGIFSIDSPRTKTILNDLGIECDDVLIISREGNSSGKSFAKVNNRTVVMSLLRDICKTIIDVHEQHENQNILKSATHIQYLDYYCRKELELPLVEYKSKYEKYIEVNNKIKELNAKKIESIRRKEFIKFQIDDIEKIRPVKDEENLLNERFKVLNSAELIQNKLSMSHSLLYSSNDNSLCAYDIINDVIKNLRSVEDSHSQIKNIADSFESMYYIMEQNISDIKKIQDEAVYDEDELNLINERLYALNSLKKKYSVNTLDEVLLYEENLKNEFYELDNIAINMEKLIKNQGELKEELKVKATVIHDIRIKQSHILKKILEKEFSFVGLEKVKLEIRIKKEAVFYVNGFDKVEFFISTNVGEPYKPLSEIISGGELSRIILCFKCAFSEKEHISSIVFDEIDTGISGVTAQRVAEKMYSLSTNIQVFCITHLPHIASFNDKCYIVWKYVKDNKTYSEIRLATDNEIIETISKMQGGENLSKISIEHAKELINNADKIKSKKII